MGKIGTAGVPSATFGTGSSTPRHSAVSRDKPVRRSAQDDDFVGVSTKNILNKLELMGLRERAGKQIRQGLKPDLFSIVYRPTKQLAEKHAQRRARV
jgi:hypothetical protein